MYSQYEEETYILRAVADVAGGRFLDVGAWHPTQFSNTRALFEKGWSGVMVEPSPGPMDCLLQEYGNEPRIELVQACVGLDNQFAKLHVTRDALSTTDPKQVARWKEKGGYYGSMLVPQVTMSDLFVTFPADFQFVNIDTEGNSLELLKAMFALGVHPLCVCFEHDWRFAESFALINDAGYKVIYENETNRVITLRG